MNEDARRMDAVAASFARHVREFHRGLPPEEQVLLEQIFQLAEAVTSQAETQGFAFDMFLKIRGKEDQAATPQLLLPAVQSVLGANLFGLHS